MNSSAYNLFFKAEREKIKANRSKEKQLNKVGSAANGLGFAKLAQTIAKRWKELDDATRAPFESRAAEDKARYDKAVAIWRSKQKEKSVSSKTEQDVVMEQADETEDKMSPIPFSAKGNKTQTSDDGSIKADSSSNGNNEDYNSSFASEWFEAESVTSYGAEDETTERSGDDPFLLAPTSPFAPHWHRSRNATNVAMTPEPLKLPQQVDTPNVTQEFTPSYMIHNTKYPQEQQLLQQQQQQQRSYRPYEAPIIHNSPSCQWNDTMHNQGGNQGSGTSFVSNSLSIPFINSNPHTFLNRFQNHQVSPSVTQNSTVPAGQSRAFADPRQMRRHSSEAFGSPQVFDSRQMRRNSTESFSSMPNRQFQMDSSNTAMFVQPNISNTSLANGQDHNVMKDEQQIISPSTFRPPTYKGGSNNV